MNTLVIYHSADYDGIFCHQIAKKFLGTENVLFQGWNFGDPKIKPFSSTQKIYILDLSPECLESPMDFKEKIVWIDHHKSSIEKWSKDIAGYRIDGVSACRLAWQWFAFDYHDEESDPTVRLPLPNKQAFLDRKVEEPVAVMLAGEYDVWDHRGDGDLQFQFGLDAQQMIDWDWIFDDENEEYVGEIVEAGKAAMQCYAKRDADVVKERSFLYNWEGFKFLCLNTLRCNSNTFNAKDKPETGHDALLAFGWNGQEWSISLYHANHRKDIDLSLIAVKYAGGGHRGACGFRSTGLLPFMQ